MRTCMKKKVNKEIPETKNTYTLTCTRCHTSWVDNMVSPIVCPHCAQPIEPTATDQKIQELIYWVNQDSTDGRIDDIYISHVERLCEELGIDFDTAYTLYESAETDWTE